MANAKQTAAKSAKQTAAKSAKQTAAKSAPAKARPAGAHVANEWAVRLVVRGRTERNGPVLRTVRSIEVGGADLDAAQRAAQRIGDGGAFAEMSKAAGFVETTTTRVYPPVGLLVRGGVSKGFGMLPGATVDRAIAGKAVLPVFVSREHKAGAAAPADVAAQYK